MRGRQGRLVARLESSDLIKFQSDLLLPLARLLYLLVACLSLGAAVLGLLAVLWFQLSAMFEVAPKALLPQSISPEPQAISLDIIDARLRTPSAVRFVPTPHPDTLLGSDRLLGYLELATGGGAANYPDGIRIIGGRDADLFTEAPTLSGGTGLKPTKALLQRSVGQDAQALAHRPFELRLLATDRSGNSAPLNVTFKLGLSAPAGVRPA